MNTKSKVVLIAIVFLIPFALIGWKCKTADQIMDVFTPDKLTRFSSDEDLVKAFKESKTRVGDDGVMKEGTATAPSSVDGRGGGAEYSKTNIQVEGVDEADIVKNDGKYIYAIAGEDIVIAEAYPVSDAKVLSKIQTQGFVPRELFINGDRMLVFGMFNYDYSLNQGELSDEVSSEIIPPRRYLSTVSARLYDVKDRKNPKLLHQSNIEGNYITSRKIGSDVYFVVGTYPYYVEKSSCKDIVPRAYESMSESQPGMDDFHPIAKCTEIGYVPPLQADSFITVASISMANENEKMEKEVIVGSSNNVYASVNNLYVAQDSWPEYHILGETKGSADKKAIISKFQLDKGKIKYQGKGEVKGHILNQFSMDEFDNHFRIATTVGEVWNENEKSQNNVYILDKDLKQVGSLENLAPGEKIYSVRFMGERGYLVTFKKIDPLFVVDLSDHANPAVLGKLKIPGYSDYLHPYDATHIIGIGKMTVEAAEELKEERNLNFAWYQGIKIAMFDVSNVSNPIEMHKVVIGDRGTDSPVLTNHKALLFDKDKNLMVLPILLAEIKGEKTEADQYGDYVYQGAYVYNVTLQNGFDLRGRVTHYDDSAVFDQSGYYFEGEYSIERSLYIDNVLYTLSDKRLKLNDLNVLNELKKIDLNN